MPGGGSDVPVDAMTDQQLMVFMRGGSREPLIEPALICGLVTEPGQHNSGALPSAGRNAGHAPRIKAGRQAGQGILLPAPNRG